LRECRLYSYDYKGVPDELAVLRGPQRGSVIKEAHDGPRPTIGRQSRKRAFSSLTGAIDKYHASVPERLGNDALRMTGNQVRHVSNTSSVPEEHENVVSWTVMSWSFGRYIRGHLDGEMMVI
jgi:hypothetical protein